jgi:hypothetical protein
MSPAPKIIGHLDSECFYVSAERVRQANLRCILRPFTFRRRTFLVTPDPGRWGSASRRAWG